MKAIRDQKRNSIGNNSISKEEVESLTVKAAPSSPRRLSSKDTGIYADDFVDESESDYSDDFEEDDGVILLNWKIILTLK